MVNYTCAIETKQACSGILAMSELKLTTAQSTPSYLNQRQRTPGCILLPAKPLSTWADLAYDQKLTAKSHN